MKQVKRRQNTKSNEQSFFVYYIFEQNHIACEHYTKWISLGWLINTKIFYRVVVDLIESIMSTETFFNEGWKIGMGKSTTSSCQRIWFANRVKFLD